MIRKLQHASSSSLVIFLAKHHQMNQTLQASGLNQGAAADWKGVEYFFCSAGSLPRQKVTPPAWPLIVIHLVQVLGSKL
jgi:hypothetical protein